MQFYVFDDEESGSLWREHDNNCAGGGARHITVIDGIDVMGEREGDA